MAYSLLATSGTISIDDGGTAVTGVDTAFELLRVEGGLLVCEAGYGAVESVESDTALTLEGPLIVPAGSSGGAVTDGEYLIYRGSSNAADAVRIYDQFTEIRKLINQIQVSALTRVSAYGEDLAGRSAYDDEWLDVDGNQFVYAYIDNGVPIYSAKLSDTSGDWSDEFSFAGPAGQNGQAFDYSGSGAPSGGIGSDGSTYLDIDNGDTYEKSGGTWTLQGSVKGGKGDKGDAATLNVGSTTTGLPGTNATVTNSGSSSAAVFDFTIPKGEKGDTGQAFDHSGSGAPDSGLGSDGETYLDIVNGDTYEKAGGTWGLEGNIGIVGNVTLDQYLTFNGTIALEQAEDRLTGPVASGADGNGLYDGFNVLDYVDVAGAVNLDTGTAGQLKPVSDPAAATVETANGPHTMTGNVAGWTPSYTVVQVIKAAEISASGDKVRITIKGPITSGTSLVIDEMFIGHAATSGNAYDFDGTQVAVTVASSGSVTLAADAEVTTDWITYDIDETKDLVIAFHLTNGDKPVKSGISANYKLYNKALDEAGDTVKSSGYILSGANQLAIVSKVEISNPDETVGLSLEVENTPMALAEAPDWAVLLAFVDLNGATLNTDLSFSIACDGGTDFAVATMTELFDRPGGTKVYSSGKLDLTGIAAGTSGKWLIETANGVRPSIHAAGIAFGVNA